ncbi:MAG: HlyD family secretion protein [Rudaea sp.]
MTDKQYGAPDVAEPETKPPRKKRKLVLWILGPAIVLIIGGWLYITSGRYVSTDNAYIGADQVTIAPQVGGRVVEVDVRENQFVHKGDVLFRIDPEPLQLTIDQLNAQMDAIGDFLASSKDSFHAAIADLGSSSATLHYDQTQLERMRQLRAKGLVAQKLLDDAANEVATARGKRDSDEATVSKNRNMLGGDEKAPVQTLAGYKMIKAQLDKATLDLDHASVRAPSDGVIGKTDLRPGDFLQVGQAAMPLVATDVWVDANFKETDLTHVKVGQPVNIDVDTYPDHPWTGHVASISPASGARFSILPAQNATGNWVKIVQRIPVRITIDDQGNGPILRAGMSANVKIDTGKQNSLLGRIEGAREPAPSSMAVARH